jgi:hypothetical protein
VLQTSGAQRWLLLVHDPHDPSMQAWLPQSLHVPHDCPPASVVPVVLPSFIEDGVGSSLHHGPQQDDQLRSACNIVTCDVNGGTCARVSGRCLQRRNRLRQLRLPRLRVSVSASCDLSARVERAIHDP